MSDMYKFRLLPKASEEEKLQKLNKSLKGRDFFLTLSGLGMSFGSLEMFGSCTLWGLGAMR